ncbi:LysR family transcriptional regulator [Variovorax sp. J22G73]|uniref:LysR family transcriptional regulator n=1 Tax=unclassified Variovorax TaxID=663243 RepID=UPI0025760601|nr:MULTISPECIES: LysR family transcriptional regulator [unclassified Variovorax]MDM0004928.1 LysR family transcriptional regulator [Variovorax sp. J22R203]MDM0098344.1 LysR family transcriptional regulator [Variovorax sp. J22G73]
MPINELRSIATFAKTAELGSLRQAAAAQGMTPQAASQALAQLEHHLGVRLFHRTTRSLSLTDEGRQFLEAAQPALVGLQRALHMARRATDGIAGPLRIVGPRSTFAPLLGPLLDEFCSRYPEVQPDVQLDDRIGNWVEDRVDVGFRVGPSPADGVIARRLFGLQLVLCAAPSYLLRHGAPHSLEALASHRCSAFRHPATGKLLPWYVKVGDDVVEQPIVPALCLNDESLETEAVLAGQAIGSLTSVIAAAHIRAGRLVPLLTAHVADRSGVFIYYGSRAAQPARARAFIDLAIERLTDNPAYRLTAQELASAEAEGRAAHARG